MVALASLLKTRSSRSHAVFTITLNQTMQSTTQSSDDTQFVTSKLTFVDLAGSERIKRTGAEGQRMKEGIQINSGLFNLGKVINGLADDQRIKNGTKASHIPYRNSKLTHLLKDALGGNSQTLFLVCVSPAESNESETFSTLSYARQARNIKNKPLRNVDKHQLELRRLKYAVKTWMTKAVFQLFADPTSTVDKQNDEDISVMNVSLTDLSSPQVDGKAKGGATAELFNRPEVQHYIQSINEKIAAQMEGGLCPSPRKLRLSIMPSPRNRSGNSIESASPTKVSRQLFGKGDNALTSPRSGVVVGGNPSRRRSMEKCMAVMEGGDSEETEQLVSRMIELVHKEKDELLKDLTRHPPATSSTNPDSPSNSTVISCQTTATVGSDGSLEEDDEDDSANMALVEQEIVEKEEILDKLMDAVKGFGTMKQDYESLLHEINSLEVEKTELEKELEVAKKQEEALVKNKKTPINPLAVLKLKERFTKVQNELSKMKTDRQKKETAYRVMQRESKQCEKLQNELKKMKETKVALMRAQKTQSMNAQKMKKESDLKMGQMKKIDVKKQRQMNTLKSELVKKQRVLGHKDREIGRIQSKLKACEDHITQLLTMNNKKRAQLIGGSQTKERSNGLQRKDSSNAITSSSTSGLSQGDKNYLKSSINILDNMILDRVDKEEKKRMYTKKTTDHKDLSEELAEDVAELQILTAKRNSLEAERTNGTTPEDFDETKSSELKFLSQSVVSMEDNIDKITHELNMYNADIADLYCDLYPNGKESKEVEENNTWEEMGKAIINGLNQTQCQSLLWDMTLEKSENLNKLEAMKRKFLESKDACEHATETISELEKDLLHTKMDAKARLDESEKLRVHDLWAVMQSHSTSDADNQVGRNIAITRAQELETALEGYMEQEAEFKNEIAALRVKNEELEKTMLENRFVHGATGDTEEENASTGELQKCFSHLKEVWETLGTPLSDREVVLTGITTASKTAQQLAVENAYTALQVLKSQEDQLTTGFEDMCGVLDIEEGVYFDEDTLKTLPLLQRIAMLQGATGKAEVEMTTRTEKLFQSRTKLVDLMTDMNMDSTDVCSNLQRLLRVSNEMTTASAQALASHLLAKGVMISPSHLSQWESKIRALSVEQVQNVAQANTLKTSLLQLRTELDLTSASDLTSIEFGIADTLKQRVMNLLFYTGNEKVTGDLKLVQSLEKCVFVLQTLKANRKNGLDHLAKLTKCFNNYLQISLAEKDVVLTDAISMKNVENRFQNVLSHLPGQLEEHVMNVQIKLASMVTENRLSVSEYDNKLGQLATSAVRSKEEIAMLHDLDEPINDLVGLSAFIEEDWLRHLLLSLQKTWEENRSQVIFSIVLGSEVNRLNLFVDALRDIKRYDNQLSEHVNKMEEFEISSKQDRQKVLMGSSKALMEEETFRKKGKRRFEQITERLVQSARTAQSHSDGMQMDISHLSQQGQDLLRGKIQERIELMHLHTTTHGTKRWSGDKNTLQDSDLQLSQSLSVPPPVPPPVPPLPLDQNEENVINNQNISREKDLSPPLPPPSCTPSSYSSRGKPLSVTTSASKSPPKQQQRPQSRSRSPTPRSKPKLSVSELKLSSPKENPPTPRGRTKKEMEGFPRETSSNPFDSLLNKT